MILYLSATWRAEGRFAQKPCGIFALHNTTRFTPNASFYCSVAEGKPLLKNVMIGGYQTVGYCSSAMTISVFFFFCSSFCCYLEVPSTFLTSQSGISMWLAWFSRTIFLVKCMLLRFEVIYVLYLAALCYRVNQCLITKIMDLH